MLEQCRSNTKGGEDIIRALIMDCEAIQSGQDHMILDALRQDAYLSRTFAKNPNWDPATSASKDDTTRNESKESKKDK